MGWFGETMRGIMAPEAVDNVCDVCGAVNVHDKDCPGRSSHARIAAKPRLAAVTKAPTREAFDAWREHPVTLFVFAALARAAKEQETAWAGTSWEGGLADQNLLNELRVRADAYNSMQEADYRGLCEWAGVPGDGENSAA